MSASPEQMTQIAEWDAVEVLNGTYTALQNTHTQSPVYPSMVANYENAIRKFLLAAKANKRAMPDREA